MKRHFGTLFRPLSACAGGRAATWAGDLPRFRVPLVVGPLGASLFGNPATCAACGGGVWRREDGRGARRAGGNRPARHPAAGGRGDGTVRPFPKKGNRETGLAVRFPVSGRAWREAGFAAPVRRGACRASRRRAKAGGRGFPLRRCLARSVLVGVLTPRALSAAARAVAGRGARQAVQRARRAGWGAG